MGTWEVGGRKSRGELGGTPRVGGSGGNTASISPTHSSPWEPTGVLSLDLCPLRPPPAMWVLWVWKTGEEE